MPKAERSRPRAAWRLPAGIWALGVVSLCMDASSELVHSLLPLFLVTVLGASAAAIGVIEGIAEATASVLKVYSGAISDRLARRKPMVLLGYGLSALTKPLFPLAGSVGWVLGARVADRIGKGLRGAPRDALVADLVPPAARGAAYGLRQALDSAGALLGPLIAAVGMVLLAGDLRAVLWIAVVPAFLAVAVLALFVREGQGQGNKAIRSTLVWDQVRGLPAAYWHVVLLGALFTLARFSEAFLVLRAHDLGLAPRHAPFVFVAMNAVYAASAYPAGRAADRGRARAMLVAGIAGLAAANLVLLLAATPAAVLAGAALWGLHMGLTQGLLAKLVADVSPIALRGTAFGMFQLTTGLALLSANVGAGALWSGFGAGAVFAAGLVLSLLACGLIALRTRP